SGMLAFRSSAADVAYTYLIVDMWNWTGTAAWAVNMGIQLGAHAWAGAPTQTFVSHTATRFTWDVSMAPPSVPDSGGSLALFIASLCGLLAIAPHRRRETPRPRAVRGV